MISMIFATAANLWYDHFGHHSCQGWFMVFARKGLGWVVGLGLILAGCGGTKEGYVERPVEGLYNTAMDQLYDKEYDQAAKTFDEVDRQHPYSVWATKAQIMSAYVL